jgi:hypothetical protein
LKSFENYEFFGKFLENFEIGGDCESILGNMRFTILL